MNIGQPNGGDTQFEFAQAPIVLAAGARAGRAGRFVRTLIKDQQAARLQRWVSAHLGLDLVEDGLLAPGRIRHELLQGLPIAALQAPINIGKVAPVFHAQLAAPVEIGIRARVARPSAQARSIAGPEGMQIVAQRLDRCQGQPPSVWVTHVLS